MPSLRQAPKPRASPNRPGPSPNWSPRAARNWRAVAELALALVAALLALGLVRQFAVSGPRWLLLDRLALVPQWKFFGQVGIGQDEGWCDDLHLLARRGEGEWQELVWCAERRWIEALWNPHARSRDALAARLALLATASDVPPTALAYLTVLKHCLGALPGEAPLQFAIAATRGRGDRPLALKFLSGRHA